MKLKFIKKWKKLWAHRSNYGAIRPLGDIKYIGIHYTGNDGDTARNNCLYFRSPNRHASAHVFLDGSGVSYKSVPIKNVAYSVGGLYTLKNGAGKYYKKATNYNTINIEMCNSVGKVPDNVYKEAVEVTRYYMKKYHVPASHVLRHWDINGKDCPDPWIGENNKMWKQFKKDISK